MCSTPGAEGEEGDYSHLVKESSGVLSETSPTNFLPRNGRGNAWTYELTMCRSEKQENQLREEKDRECCVDNH